MHNDTNKRVEAISGMTANGGMYDNRIPQGSFPADYTEICFKGGSTLNDQHIAGQLTAGGNCLPDDIGFIIEQNERTAQEWESARETCLNINMRLPEIFEFKLSCDNAGAFGLLSMTGNNEWSSNFPMAMTSGSSPAYGASASTVGSTGCNFISWGWVGHSNNGAGSLTFRCVK